MLSRRGTWAWLAIGSIAIGWSVRAAEAGPGTPAPPVCAAPAACATACGDGAGDRAACVLYADALLRGRGVEPDRKKALALLTTTCGGDDEETDAPGVADACLALGDLRRDGWMFEIDRSVDGARTAYQRAAGRAHCGDADTSGCATRARAWTALASLTTSSTPDATLSAAADDAGRGCTGGHSYAACMALHDLGLRGADRAVAQRQRDAALAGLIAACTDADSVDACLEIVNGPLAADKQAAITAALQRGCGRGDRRACGQLRFDELLDVAIESHGDLDKSKAAFTALVATCDGDGHPQCSRLALDLIVGRDTLGIAADPAAGLAMAERRCALGDAWGCQAVATARGARGPAALRDEAKAAAAIDRSCRLLPYKEFCGCTDDHPTPSCVVRATYTEALACERDQVGACVRVGVRFRDGDGVDHDVERAAGFLRRGCDAADKSACATLDEMCRDHPELPVAQCQQSLIQSDLFFEAEFQAAAGGDVDMIDADHAPAATTGATAVTLGSLAASLPTSARRGHLDADLVVDVVLDRARQAAIKLVVRELTRAQHRTGRRYLQDLLDQGSRLLADPTTLRREKFQDLGMTVVRAFVAANLIDSLYPSSDGLRAAPVIGATVTDGADRLATAAGAALPADVHGYLVDVAYYWLGQTRLFGRSASQSSEAPTCPWPDGPGVTLCTQLGERATAERAIGVSRVLDALRLVKLLRDGGFEDVRRLIEAAAQSRTIADLGSTPGLVLQAWRDQIVVGSRGRVERIRAGVSDLRTLLRASVYADRGLELDDLIAAAATAREAVGPAAVRLTIGDDNIQHVYRVLRIIEKAKRDLQATPLPAPPPPPPPPPTRGAPSPARPSPAPPAGLLDPRAVALATVRKEVIDGFQEWGPRSMVEVQGKLEQLGASLDRVGPALDKLDSAIADVRAVFARYPGPDGKVSLDVGALPLYASVELTRELRTAATTLGAVDDALRAAFPGEVPARLRFARTSTARLIAFLDLMERVARQSPLTMRAGDVIAALRMLGTFRVGGFDAPLFDVLEPVIDAIRTHEPMSLELLFAVIGRVRLDTLIGTLQGRQNACADDASVDCWITRLIHALQESVERDGDAIRVDGGKFAQRLAHLGDDFRHRHTWRGYFHLTVGVGGLYSDPALDEGSDRRPVPQISEQVGFGMASPSLLGDRLTFKVGAAASGILYRAILDSDESNAIMIHPLFLALDVGDLVEAYVSPAVIMLYPPDGDRDGAVRWGVAAGLSVPLSAYLERL